MRRSANRHRAARYGHDNSKQSRDAERAHSAPDCEPMSARGRMKGFTYARASCSGCLAAALHTITYRRNRCSLILGVATVMMAHSARNRRLITFFPTELGFRNDIRPAPADNSCQHALSIRRRRAWRGHNHSYSVSVRIEISYVSVKTASF